MLSKSSLSKHFLDTGPSEVNVVEKKVNFESKRRTAIYVCIWTWMDEKREKVIFFPQFLRLCLSMDFLPSFMGREWF